MRMTDPVQFDRAGSRAGTDQDDALQRLGRHAIALLQAARDSGDLALIAQAEAMAMAVGFTLAAQLPSAGSGAD